MALIMGMITTLLFFVYINQQDKAVDVQTEPLVTAVIAKEKININQVITRDMLSTINVSEKELHPLTVRDVKEIEGTFATANIEKDEVLLNHRFKTEKEEIDIISRKIQDGYRAVSVGVNFVQSVSNLIEPEDYVDVVFNEAVKQGQETVIKTEQIITNARVLAIGRKMVSNEIEESEYVEYSAVTLELSPSDGQVLINASERGTIYLVLNTRLKTKEDEKP
ncbi:Flp pilus assembly protein CpaB [Litchfieldia alkalitelluris]|uniref:Flp pilus assembly protein CpaB n=1 Tax=Litchfieldia alkalitelluris TaxID=304268 RepID=UPI00195CC876|nr:Flp pilus assembly protein CpaB [Litchfieldia alkalitelluris]